MTRGEKKVCGIGDIFVSLLFYKNYESIKIPLLDSYEKIYIFNRRSKKYLILNI